MSIRIKKGVEPVGTVFNIHHWEDGVLHPVSYKVSFVSGLKKFVPSEDSIVFLQVQGRPGGSPPMFYSIPLISFVSNMLIQPLDEKAVFWELTKSNV